MPIFDFVKKRVNIISRKAKRTFDSKSVFDLRGKLEIFGHKKGKLIYYDGGENTVTIWAKHANIHLLSGEIFSSWGHASMPPYNQRLFDTDDASAHTSIGVGFGTNKDGTQMSGQQHFADNSNPDFNLESRWSKSTIDAQTTLGDRSYSDVQMKFPFFPTKMLFGTGFEWSQWVDIPADYRVVYTGQGWDEAVFNSQIGNVKNVYSNTWSGTSLTQKRSMNDIYAAALEIPTMQDTDFAIPGAVKNGTYEGADSADPIHNERWWPKTAPNDPAFKTYWDGGNEFLKSEWAGIGDPAFLYCRRESRYFQTGSEVQLSNDASIENKITFVAVMPEQTGSNAGIYYPYNGYTLKVAALYCDARIILANSVPTGAGDDHTDEKANYDKMPYGITFAKRYISPITKSHDVSLTARWTIYL